MYSATFAPTVAIPSLLPPQVLPLFLSSLSSLYLANLLFTLYLFSIVANILLLGPAPLTFTIVDNSDGTYTVTYTATVAGEYIISIKHRNVDHIQNSPRKVVIAVLGMSF